MHRIKQEGACLIGANEWLELRMKRKKARDWEGGVQSLNVNPDSDKVSGP
jgi:hypothetical protein